MKKIILLVVLSILMIDSMLYGQMSCEYTLEMNDTFGDGWNDGSMDVLVNGIVVLDDVALDDDPTNDGTQGFLTFMVSTGDDVTTVFVEDGEFPEEISYRILNSIGIEEGAGNTISNITTGTLFANCPSCFQPIDLTAINITTTSADLNWIDLNDPTAMFYDLEWSETGFMPGMGILETELTETTFQLIGLDPNTSYDFYIISSCDVDDVSEISGPITFTTMPVMAPPGECEYTLQMFDTFGDGWNGGLMDVFRNGEIVLNDVALDDDPTNDGSMGVLSFEVIPGDDITTVFVVDGGFPEEITYNILDNLGVIVGSGNAETNIDAGTITAECPDCVSPGNLATSNFIEGISIDISWDAIANAIGYNWEIQDLGVPQGNSGVIASGNTAATTETALGAFFSGESYTLYVQTDCGDDGLSTFSSLDFTIPPTNDDCEDAIALECGTTITGSTVLATDSGANAAPDVFYTYTGSGFAENITLSLCDEATDYDSLLRVFDDECNLVNEIAENDDACGLQSELVFESDGTTIYTIMVEGFGAGSGNYSMAITCEEILGVGDSTFDGFTFFPNPAQNTLNISAQTEVQKIILVNLVGQIVLEKQIDATNSQIDMSRLTSGVYLMQVSANGQIGTYKVIKE